MSTDRDIATLAEARRLRDAARILVRDDLVGMQGEFSAQALSTRLRTHVLDLVLAARDQTITIVRNNPVVVALTGTTLGLWFARRPLSTLALGWWQKFRRHLERVNS